MENNFKIVLWNANGLAHRSLEVKKFLVEQNIDIMLVSETHFTNKNYFSMPNYMFYHTNHPDKTARGGTAVIIKTQIKHHAAEEYRHDYLQATTVVIDDWNGPLAVSAIYCPPNHTINHTLFETFFAQLGHRFLCGGDWNAKHPWWGSRLQTPTPRGRQLYEAIQKHNCFTISSGEPTYWPSDPRKRPDLIDFAIARGIQKNITARTSLDLSSDHSPVIIAIDAPLKATLRTRTKICWPKFKEIVSEKIFCGISLRTVDDLENSLESFNAMLQSAVSAASITTILSHCHGKISNQIEDKIREKRRLRKIWQSTRNAYSKRKLNKAIKDLKALLQEERNNKIASYLQKITPTEATDYSLWKATKKINRPQNYIAPIRKNTGDWARTDHEKGLAFALHLSDVFKPYDSEITRAEEQLLIPPPVCSPLDNAPISPVKLAEVIDVIKNIRTKKAPGYDQITGKMLKELPPIALRFITIILNACFRLCHFPAQWKEAQIILIQKPGKDAGIVASYRPISLLPVMSKIAEKIILSRMDVIIRAKELIPHHQFGFRSHHSTIEQVNRIASKVQKAFEEKHYVSAVFLDVAQAFDKVWHEGLLLKIRQHFPIKLYKILKSYLENRTYRVKINSEISDRYQIGAGVPQGSVLGPTLYLLYTADIPTSSEIMTATYADDTAILASSTSAPEASQLVQNHLNKLQQWLKIWRIKVNANKSCHITFTLRKGNCPQVSLYGNPIPQSDEVKYLGMHLDRRLTWKTHIWTKRKQLGLKLRKFYWLLGGKSYLALENKVLIYKSILKPVWLYGIQLWGAAAKSNINIIERYQAKVLRSMVDAPWFVPNEVIRCDLSVPLVREEIKNVFTRYKNRLHEHSNPLALELTIQPPPSRLKRRQLE